MRKMTLVAAVAAAAFAAPHLASASDNNSGRYKGGADIGPLGQCFDPPDCGHHNGYRGRGSFAQACPIVRERMMTDTGRVIFRQYRAC